MLTLRALLMAGLVAAVPVRAVYAPIPEQEQGKDLTFLIRAGFTYDTNIFGAPSGRPSPTLAAPIETTVWTIAPKASYNSSLTDQTFMSASYGLTIDHFDKRPGDKTLDSHELTARVAHAFTKATTIDVFDVYTIARNPEALLPGVAAITANQDQSYRRNQLDGRFVTPLSPKATATVKARSIYYRYRDKARLGPLLDRTENLYGLAGDYAMLPEVKVVGEFRHQDVHYRIAEETKDKSSNYLMGGVDYDVAKKVSLSGRLGIEWREREAERDTTAPYAEFSTKYNYTERSFIAGGAAYTFEEASDVTRFNDTEVRRFFVNVQHQVSPLIVASGSLTFEPSELQGRRGQADVSEKTTRLGGALSYLPTKNWVVTASYDFDRVRSDDRFRSMKRERVALNAIYNF